MYKSKKILIQILLISGILSIMPMPSILNDFTPFWALLFFTYWLLYIDDNSHYRYALIFGCYIDVLQYNIIGQSALALVLSTFIILKFKKSFHISNRFSKLIYVLLVAIIYLLVIIIVNAIQNGYDFNYAIIFSPITTIIFWPIVYLLMHNISKKMAN